MQKCVMYLPTNTTKVSIVLIAEDEGRVRRRHNAAIDGTSRRHPSRDDVGRLRGIAYYGRLQTYCMVLFCDAGMWRGRCY